MQSASFDVGQSKDSNRSRCRSRQQYDERRAVFEDVVKRYVKLRSLPYVTVANPDSEASYEERNHKWSPDAAHFMIDVERATEVALGDDLGLQEIWFRLAEDTTVPAKAAWEVISRCGKLYLARRLHKYFSPSPRVQP